MSKCVNCQKEINNIEAFCLTCHEEVLEYAKNQITDLETKLAKSEKKYEDRKQFCISEIRFQIEIINNLLEENEQLRQQLAENESKRKSLEEKIKWLSEENEECFIDGQKYNELREQKDKEIAKLKQSQKQFAIEELERVQVQCQFDITFADYEQEQRLYDYINNRIKSLKGEK